MTCPRDQPEPSHFEDGTASPSRKPSDFALTPTVHAPRGRVHEDWRCIPDQVRTITHTKSARVTNI
eukprot:1193153-Prorocentrum_minimum.AAC.2